MTLYVKKGRLRLWFYSSAGFAGFVLKQILKNAEKQAGEKQSGTDIMLTAPDKKTLKSLTGCVKAAKKQFGKLVLLSVNAADGTKVRITL